MLTIGDPTSSTRPEPSVEDRDNVLAFPRRGSALTAVEHVAAALAELGEPARVSELQRLLDDDVRLSRMQIVALLVAHGADDSHPDARALFRPVSLNGEVAWAFTPRFREALRQRGLRPKLRGRGAVQDG